MSCIAPHPPMLQTTNRPSFYMCTIWHSKFRTKNSFSVREWFRLPRYSFSRQHSLSILLVVATRGEILPTISFTMTVSCSPLGHTGAQGTMNLLQSRHVMDAFPSQVDTLHTCSRDSASVSRLHGGAGSIRVWALASQFSVAEGSSQPSPPQPVALISVSRR